MASFLSKKMQQKIEEWREQIGETSIRWILPKNYHVTLIPPWYEQNSEGVITLLKSITKPVKPFTITFETVTFGPSEKNPRLMWAKGDSPTELLHLKSYLSTSLQKETEKRTPLMHVTLARFTHQQFVTFPEKKFKEKIQWRDLVRSFAVVESHLKRSGAEYEILEEITL